MKDVVVAVAEGRAAGKHGHGGIGGSPSSTPPCAACKMLRRRCSPGCVFAPYFPAGEPHRFACVHKVFGASNISKLLQVPLSHATLLLRASIPRYLLSAILLCSMLCLSARDGFACVQALLFSPHVFLRSAHMCASGVSSFYKDMQTCLALSNEVKNQYYFLK
jgi:hypothetical protein